MHTRHHNPCPLCHSLRACAVHKGCRFDLGRGDEGHRIEDEELKGRVRLSVVSHHWTVGCAESGSCQLKNYTVKKGGVRVDEVDEGQMTTERENTC